MNVDCIILDEAASMLDPVGKRELIDLLRRLNSEEGITVIHITHETEEILVADRVVALKAGEIVYDGSPVELVMDSNKMRGCGLEPNGVSKLFQLLRNAGLTPKGFRGIEELAEAICEFAGKAGTKKKPA